MVWAALPAFLGVAHSEDLDSFRIVFHPRSFPCSCWDPCNRDCWQLARREPDSFLVQTLNQHPARAKEEDASKVVEIRSFHLRETGIATTCSGPEKLDWLHWPFEARMVLAQRLTPEGREPTAQRHTDKGAGQWKLADEERKVYNRPRASHRWDPGLDSSLPYPRETEARSTLEEKMMLLLKGRVQIAGRWQDPAVGFAF